MSPAATPLRVLIVGAGVAGLETALGLAELAGDRVQATLLDPAREFVMRPMTPREPFNHGTPQRYGLSEIARDIGTPLITDGFRRLDGGAKVVHTTAGRQLPYDVLVLAMGAHRKAAFAHGLTIDDRIMDEQLHGLVQDIEGGYVESVAFVAPSSMAWPLPLYELALMAAGTARVAQTRTVVTLVTPEDAPLAIFGGAASAAVAARLRDNGVRFVGSAHASVPDRGAVLVHPGSRTFKAERIVALPQLFGPSLSGVPSRSVDGFIMTDPYGRAAGLTDVFAAGDATSFPIKHGGISAQQADTVARTIAAHAGATVSELKFHPEINGLLLGGGPPLYLSAHVTGGHGAASRASEEPLWEPGAKIVARYLTPFLTRRELGEALAPAGHAR